MCIFELFGMVDIVFFIVFVKKYCFVIFYLKMGEVLLILIINLF